MSVKFLEKKGFNLKNIGDKDIDGIASYIKQKNLSLDVNSFIQSIKDNELNTIMIFMLSDLGDLTLGQKFEYIIENLCSLSIETIAFLLPTFDVKYNFGKTPIYVKSVECKPHIFGFLSTYYSPDEKMRMMAYQAAAELGRLDILKKIHRIPDKYLSRVKSKKFTKEVEIVIASDRRGARAKKDTSPEDFLKEKQKKMVAQQLKKNSSRMLFPSPSPSPKSRPSSPSPKFKPSSSPKLSSTLASYKTRLMSLLRS